MPDILPASAFFVPRRWGRQGPDCGVVRPETPQDAWGSKWGAGFPRSSGRRENPAWTLEPQPDRRDDQQCEGDRTMWTGVAGLEFPPERDQHDQRRPGIRAPKDPGEGGEQRGGKCGP